MTRVRTFIAIDINNYDYDFATAHQIKTVFPVSIRASEAEEAARLGSCKMASGGRAAQ
jgi:uncharacterized membrane protein